MIHFTCTHCQTPINGVTIIIDKTHFVHTHCEKEFKKTKTSNLLSDDFSSEFTKRMRERIKKKWGSSGLLEGLKEPVPSNFAMMLECCKSSKIE